MNCWPRCLPLPSGCDVTVPVFSSRATVRPWLVALVLVLASVFPISLLFKEGPRYSVGADGQIRQPHSGEDVAAPKGTPVVAMNDGMVRLTANHFFSGKGVILDYGSLPTRCLLCALTPNRNRFSDVSP